MDRRTLLSAFGTSLLVASIAAKAQRGGKVARIGYLSTGTPTANAALHNAFIDGLRDRGWIERQNIAIEYRWENVGNSTLDALASELASLPLDAIFAANTPMALAMKRTGTTVPIVFAAVSEPVAIGLVDSLARPGRNFTGLSTINRELMPKRLEVLKEAIPVGTHYPSVVATTSGSDCRMSTADRISRSAYTRGLTRRSTGRAGTRLQLGERRRGPPLA